MNEYWLKAQDFWQKREERERKAMQIAGIAIAIFIFYSLILSPLNNHVEAMRQHIKTESKTLAFMRSANESIKKLSAENTPTKPSTPVMILSGLQQMLESANLSQYAEPLKQTSNEMIEMHFKAVDFDQLMSFMINAVKQQPIILLQFSATSTDNIGQVNADLQWKVI